MTTLGQRLQATATRLINLYGDDLVTFTRVTPGAFVPSTGALGSGSTLTYTAKGVSSQFTVQEINNDTILFTDLKYMIGLTSQVPAVNDSVVLGDSITYRVMSVLKEDLQNNDIYYTLQLRV